MCGGGGSYHLLCCDHYVSMLIIKISVNEDLNLKQLSSKIVVLLALANASRTSTLDIRYMLRKDSEVCFPLHSLHSDQSQKPP